MNVCVLSDETIEEFNPGRYLVGHEWEMITVQAPIREFVARLAEQAAFEVYLNIFEGFDDLDNSAVELVQALEEFNLPFTGAGTAFYNPSREQMQQAAERHGIRFARGFNAASLSDLSQAEGLRYPLMVKHPNSFGSTGMMRDSRVETRAELEGPFQRIAAQFGSARVEEFIEGRELTCLVVDNPDDPNAPFAYPPAEMTFPPGETFMHQDVKWVSLETDVIPLADEQTAARVQELSIRFYRAMHGSGYARTDIRMRPDGELVIIEINPNCGILYALEDKGPADLPISWDRAGHAGFLERIFRAAILRRNRRTRN